MIAIAAQAVNGFLVTRIRLPPFIVTLGTLSVFTAITLIYAKGQTIQLPPGAFLLWTGEVFSIGSLHLSYGVVLMIVAVRGVHATRCASPPGAGTCTRSATTPRRPG